MKKMNPAKVRIVVWCLFAIAVVFCLVGECTEIRVLTVVGVIVLIGGLVSHLIFYKCPHCGIFLGRSGGDYCPYCGKRYH